MSDSDRIDETRDARFGGLNRDGGATTTPLPEKIGRYRIDKILGKGGFGLVYLAYDDQLDRPVAIKVPHARLITKSTDAETYLAEARTVANLDHSHIVPVHDVGSTEEYPCYIVSKYVGGTDLSTRLKQQPLSIIQAVELMATVAEALHHAHKQGVVHRDVKPSNILLDTEGKPYVVDFGLALREENIDTGPRYAGTPVYMSPEQARGEGHRVDGRSDIFSLGVILYEMLVGRRPFRAKKQMELLAKITTMEARPPRQIDDTVPKELERICLKAISKRASDRYTTALDMGDDLRHYLDQLPTGDETESLVTQVAPQTDPETTKIGTQSDTPKFDSESQPIRIVPKGLRSFDAHDADFFLELLPGPRDRNGLPDSLRFWKTRIEEFDADDTFSVGLIYGPSGCGKSSLVKAGLLPRLTENVISVYVESTPDDTETRLLHALKKQCPGIEDSLGLKETMTELRRGHGIPDGKKVLIVLDQFEQWLHTKGNEGNTELVQALRQCDGGRLQCIVMVRDDFWMAVTRCLSELEVELTQGKNFAPVDLFPTRHAKKVLAAFGRAFGVIPDDNRDISKEQQEFLKQSVAGLAEDDKVICVRLALFAEMMKGKPWTVASLKEVGGTKGVGVTFLEETFSTHANPKHRLHQKAVRAVLKALLPESGTDIKGEMKSYDELLEASGYANHHKSFNELIRILDNEIRLITPTDPEESDKESNLDSQIEIGQKYYQLSHDYLVPSLRDWLTAKQKETRRGRAELCLAERSALWNAKPENRRLPSWWESLKVRLFTDNRKWTSPQRKMMRQATLTHGIQMVAGMALVGSVLLLINYMSPKPLEIFMNPGSDLAARKRAFDDLNLDDPDVLKAINTTFQREEDFKLLFDHALPKLKEHALTEVVLLPEAATARLEFLKLIRGVVERNPDPFANKDSTRDAFEVFCNLASPRDVIKVINQKKPQFKDKRFSKTNESMRSYVKELSPEHPDNAAIAADLAVLFDEHEDKGILVASLNEEIFLRELGSLKEEIRNRFLRRMIRFLKTDPTGETGIKTVQFLNSLPVEDLVSYFFDAIVYGDVAKEAVENLKYFAENTPDAKKKEIGDEFEKRLKEKEKQDVIVDSELRYFILGAGHLGTLVNEDRVESCEIVKRFLDQREQFEERDWLDSVVTVYAELQSHQAKHFNAGMDLAGIQSIQKLLADSWKSKTRVAAAKALGILDHQESWPLLNAIVRQHDENSGDLCSAALEAMETLERSRSDDPESRLMPLLIDLLSLPQEQRELRLTALDVFERVAGPDDIDEIIPFLITDLGGDVAQALQRVMANAGDDAGIIVKKLLPTLARDYRKYQQQTLREDDVLAFTEFTEFHRGTLKAAKSAAVAFAHAAAIGPDGDHPETRELAARSLERVSKKFQPNLRSDIIQPAEKDEKIRTKQLEDWLDWWRKNQDRLQFVIEGKR